MPCFYLALGNALGFVGFCLVPFMRLGGVWVALALGLSVLRSLWLSAVRGVWAVLALGLSVLRSLWLSAVRGLWAVLALGLSVLRSLWL